MTTMKLLSMPACLISTILVGCEQQSKEQKVENAENVRVETQLPTAFIPTPTVGPATPTSRGAEISLDWDERDFGEIWDFDSVTTTFPFTNTGSKTLVLNRLQAGCGCTTPKADKTVLQPGESGTITVTFDPSGKSNKQDKKVTIFSNAISEPEKAFWIRSYVKQFVKINNKFLALDEMELGKSHSVEFDFFPADPDFVITSMKGTGKHGIYVTGEELDVSDGSPRRIRINVASNMPWGAFHSQLKVSGYGKTPEGKTVNHDFTIFANGKSFGKLRTDKYIIGLGTLTQGGSYNKQTRIYREDGQPFQVINTVVLQPTVGGINATPLQNLDGSYNIIISGTLPASHNGPFNAELMVQTDVPGEEILKFRVTGVVPKK